MVISSPSGMVRFGVFEFDTKSRQLSRKSVRIKLARQPIQVLCVLLDRAGEVVTREEFHKLLGPAHLFVEFEQDLDKSIQKLHEALGDSPESPRYIDTIPRVGYRFSAPVITGIPSESPAPSIPYALQQPSPHRPAASNKSARGSLWFALAAGFGIALVACSWYFIRSLHAP